ncbi:hypothetical protein ACMFMG_010630 [Clarireedia jacksonii]
MIEEDPETLRLTGENHRFMSRRRMRDPRLEHGETDYINMYLQLDHIPRIYNLLAGSFTWLLLAGYLVLPATFTSLRTSHSVAQEASKAGTLVLRAYQYLPLLWIAAVLCAIGGMGMSWLWWTWKLNYIWLINRIIIPGLMNSATGLATTIINIYTSKNGLWSVTAIVTTVVTGKNAKIAKKCENHKDIICDRDSVEVKDTIYGSL